MAKYAEMARGVLTDIGGIENITLVEHCAMRLKIHYRSKNKVNVGTLRMVDRVVGLVEKTGQVRIIIGPEIDDAYSEFLDVSGSKATDEQPSVGNGSSDDERKKNFMYYSGIFGDECTAILTPVIPAMITEGLVLAVRNLLVNYLSVNAGGRTAALLLGIFTTGLSSFPIWVGHSFTKLLRMEPVMGGFLGAALFVCSDVGGLGFLRLSAPTVICTDSMFPIVLDVAAMYFADKFLERVIPEMFVYFLKPILTMIIVVPITLIVLEPIGTMLSNGVGTAIQAVVSVASWIAMPILSTLYLYMVILGLGKAFTPIMAQSTAEIGYDPFNMAMGFIFNLCINGNILAIAFHLKDKTKKSMISSFDIAVLCGATEPALYGSLIMRPKCLVSTTIGAVCSDLIVGVFSLQNYVVGGCPGLLSLFYSLPTDGSTGDIVLYFAVTVVAIVISFVATNCILKKTGTVKEQSKKGL